ncbi:hypothetical protein NLP_5156 [Nostoc sp. 'Lobaria pulmonaria (5183) cyanobiont']|nr:hypothetical protein NLP_5156 [Nostoc sp. 'Lobaria pulmonaria (5183) cyanobiont']
MHLVTPKTLVELSTPDADFQQFAPSCPVISCPVKNLSFLKEAETIHQPAIKKTNPRAEAIAHKSNWQLGLIVFFLVLLLRRWSPLGQFMRKTNLIFKYLLNLGILTLFYYSEKIKYL